MAATTAASLALSPFVSPRSSSSSPPSPSKPTLSDQLQPLSKEFLDPPPRSRRWTSPSRRKAKDSVPDRRFVPDPSPSAAGVSAVRDALALLEKAEETEQSVAAALDEHVSSLSPKDVVAIINYERSWPRALLFFNWVKANSPSSLNVYTYNVLLRVLRRGEQWETGRGLVEEMIEQGFPPDNYTYATIITFAIRCNLPDEALSWFAKMQEAGCKPDKVTYTAVIDVLAKARRIEEALDLFSKMKSDGVPLDVVSYSTILKVHGMDRNFGEMMKVYEEMQSAGVLPNVVTFNSMISILGNAGKSPQATQLFTDMLNCGLKPSPVTLSLLFRTYAKSRNVDEAFRLFEMMKTEGWDVDTVVYNTLLGLCAQLGKVEEGEKVHTELLNSKVCKPDDWTWGILADMYVKGGKLEEGRRVVTDMVSRGRQVDLPVYMGLIQGYGNMRDFKSLLGLVDDIRAANLPFDHMLGGALLSAFVLCEEEGGKESAEILERIGIAYPKLKSVVEDLTKDSSSTELREGIRTMLNGATEDCRRPFCNLLMDLCWVRDLAEQAHQILATAVSFGIYGQLQTKSLVEWSLKLRTLSFGAARTALQSWISSLRVAIQDGGELPHLVSIEVGVGIVFIPNDSVLVMSTFILALLKEMQAPFDESRSGWLTATASDVKAWLLSSEAHAEKTPLQNTLLSV